MASKRSKLGRPPKYGPSMLEKVAAYFQDPSIANDPVPTKAGLCVYLGVSKQTLYRWAKENPEFSDSLKTGEVHQERHFIRALLDKNIPQAGIIFAAKNVLGWRDKRETQGGGDTTIQVVTGISRAISDPVDDSVAIAENPPPSVSRTSLLPVDRKGMR